MTDPCFPPSPAMIPTSVGRLALYDLGGTGHPLLLWPSLFTDHRLYARLVEVVRQRWRILLLDGPGFGRSDPPQPRTQPGQYAAAVVEILDNLRIERALFAGTSWGGQIGAHLAADQAQRMTGVLMMNTPLQPSRGGHLFEVGAARVLARTGLYARGVARAMLSPRSQRDPAILSLFTESFRGFRPRDAAITASTTLRHFPGLGGVLPRARAPLTIIMGALDRLYPAQGLLPLAEQAPGARLLVEADSAHLAPLDTPWAVAEALEELGRRAQL